MSTQGLKQALESGRVARRELENQRAKLRQLTEQLEPARHELARASNELKAALGREQLGEGNTEATQEARQAQTAALEKVLGIESGIDVLKERDADAEKVVKGHENSAKAAARDLAAALTPEALRRARAKAAEFGDALSNWYVLVSAAEGVPITGGVQIRQHDCHRILYEHGVSCIDGAVYAGAPSGGDARLSPEDLLALIESAAAEAAQ